MKYFVVADVHGFYDELIKGLEDAGFYSSNPNHIFVSLGDLFDRGDKSYECLQFVNSLPKDRKILICGNHELLLQEAMMRKRFKKYDSHNKTDKTCWEFYKHEHPEVSFEETTEWGVLEWLDNWEVLKEYTDCLKDYHILNNKLFVHGWFPYWCKTLSDLKKADWIDWYDSVWENGPMCWRNYGKLVSDDGDTVTVFCGHVHSWFANGKYHNSGKIEILPSKEVDLNFLDTNPFIDDGIVNLDSYTRITHKVNVYVFEEM